MLIRPNVLRHCQRLSIKWPRELLVTEKMRWHCQRYCSDVKRNEELLFSSQSSGIPSPLKVKQTIKSGLYDFVDGFACIQTTCPTCPSQQHLDKKSAEQTKSDDKCLFINKTTGKNKFFF